MTTQFTDNLSPAGKRYMAKTDLSSLSGQDPEQIRTLLENTPSFQSLPEAKRARTMKLVEDRLRAGGIDLTPPAPEPEPEPEKTRIRDLLKFDLGAAGEGQKDVLRGIDALATTIVKPFALMNMGTVATAEYLDDEVLAKPYLQRLQAQGGAMAKYAADVLKATSLMELPDPRGTDIVQHFFPGMTGWKATGAGVLTTLITSPDVVLPIAHTRLLQKTLDDVAKKMMLGTPREKFRGAMENVMYTLLSYKSRTPQMDMQFKHWKTLARKADGLGDVDAGRQLIKEISQNLPDKPEQLPPALRWADEVISGSSADIAVAKPVKGAEDAFSLGAGDGSVTLRPMGRDEVNVFGLTPEHVKVRIESLQTAMKERGAKLTGLEAEAAKSEALVIKGAHALNQGDLRVAEESVDALRQQVLNAWSMKKPLGQQSKDEFVEMQKQLHDSLMELEQAVIAHRAKTEGMLATATQQREQLAQQIARVAKEAEAPPVASPSAAKTVPTFPTTKEAKASGLNIPSRARYSTADKAQKAIGDREGYEVIQIGEKFAIARTSDKFASAKAQEYTGVGAKSDAAWDGAIKGLREEAKANVPAQAAQGLEVRPAVDKFTGETISPMRAATSAVMDAADEESVVKGVRRMLEELADDEWAGIFPTDVLAKLNDVPISVYKRAFEAARRGNVKGIEEAVRDIFENAGIRGMEIAQSPGKKIVDSLTNPLKGQVGAVELNPVMLRHGAMHVAALMTGFDLDAEDGLQVGPFNLKWSLDKYLRQGAPIAGVLGFGLPAARWGMKTHGEKFWGKLQNHPNLYSFVRSMHETERLPKHLWEYMQGVKKGPDLFLRKYSKTLEKLVKDFSEDELKLISDVIEQEGPDWVQASRGRVGEAASEIQGLMGRVRAALIDAGMPEEAVSKYGQKYLHRVYKDKDTSFMARAAKAMKISGSYLQSRGPDATILKKGQLEDLAKHVPDAKPGDKIYQFTDLNQNYLFHERDPRLAKAKDVLLRTHEYELEEVPKKGMGLKRDYTRWEREAMGEERNSIVRVMDFLREASHDIILGKAFQSIANDPGLSIAAKDRTAAHVGWKYVPHDITAGGVKKYGAAAGKYVSPDVKYMLDGLTNRRFHAQWADTFYRYNKKYMGMWKLGKTAMQAATHGVNTLSNFMLSWMNGDNPAKIAWEGAHEIYTQGRYFQEAVDLGLLDGNILRAETDIRAYADAIANIGKKGYFDQVKEFMANPIRDVWRRGIRVYEFEDEMFKVGTYLERRREGVPPEEALKFANQMFFDYRDVPRGVAALRDYGWIPFITWSYKAAHAIPRLALRRPERVAGVMVAWQLWNDANYAIMYENAAKEAEIAERHLSPPWMRGRREQMFGFGPPMARRQLTDDPEHAKFAEWGRWVLPLSDVTQTKAGELTAGHPLVSILYGTIANRHLGFGRPILPHEARDPDIDLTTQQRRENLVAWGEFVVQSIFPNMPGIPGSFSHKDLGRMLVNKGIISEELGQAVFGVTGNDNMGNPVSAGRYLSDLVGMKTREVNIPYADDQKILQYMGEYRKAESRLNGLAIRQERLGSVTDTDMERAVNNLLEAQQKLEERILEHHRIMDESPLRRYIPPEEDAQGVTIQEKISNLLTPKEAHAAIGPVYNPLEMPVNTDELGRALSVEPALGFVMVEENSVGRGWNPQSKKWYPGNFPGDRAGVQTIAYGHVVQPGEDFSKGITQQQAIELAVRDIATARRQVRERVKVELNEQQTVALAMLFMNTGPSANPKAIAALNRGDMDTFLEEAWGSGAIVTGRDREGNRVVLPGLVKRRELERAIWEGEIELASASPRLPRGLV